MSKRQWITVTFITAAESEATRKAALEAVCFVYLHEPLLLTS